MNKTTIKLNARQKAILRAVRAKVIATHWIKGRFWARENGKRCGCLMGLVNKETGVSSGLDYVPARPNSDRGVILAVLDRIAGERLRGKYAMRPRTPGYSNKGACRTNIISYNDHHLTRREDIVSLIDEALKS